MAIADTIQSMQTHTQNAYTAIGTKGGTIPAQKNLSNLASAINSISGGGSEVNELDLLLSNGGYGFIDDFTATLMLEGGY